MVDKVQGLYHREVGKLRDAHAPHRDGEGGFFEPPSPAVGAAYLRHAFLNVRAHGGALGLPVAALEIVHDALKVPLDDAIAVVALILELEGFPPGAVENGVHGLP